MLPHYLVKSWIVIFDVLGVHSCKFAEHDIGFIFRQWITVHCGLLKQAINWNLSNLSRKPRGAYLSWGEADELTHSDRHCRSYERAPCLSTNTQPCIPPGSLSRVPTLIGGGKGGNVTCAEWQATLSVWSRMARDMRWIPIVVRL